MLADDVACRDLDSLNTAKLGRRLVSLIIVAFFLLQWAEEFVLQVRHLELDRVRFVFIFEPPDVELPKLWSILAEELYYRLTSRLQRILETDAAIESDFDEAIAGSPRIDQALEDVVEVSDGEVHVVEVQFFEFVLAL